MILSLIVAGTLIALEPQEATDSSTAAAEREAVPEAVVPEKTLPEKAAAAEDEPLAGFSDGVAYLRARDGGFTLFPNGRLQIDTYLFRRPTDDLPHDTLLLRRARAEVAGWVGSWFFFSIAGDFALGAPAGADPVAQSWLATTDDYIVFAPYDDLALFQIGQFDAPFTLENRTSDKYFDFMERSITVRAFGAPTNKEVGGMVHGIGPDKLYYYSIGLFNGDGQNFKNVDNHVDVIGRAWIAPLALTTIEPLQRIRIGGSVWIGTRGPLSLAQNAQTTQGGYTFFSPKWTMGTTPFELHQHGSLTMYAFELDAPITHKLGVRAEFVKRDQDLDEDDISGAANGKLAAMGTANLSGHAFYIEGWYWLIGSDEIIGEPGLQLPTRFKKFGTKPPEHGLSIVARFERLAEVILQTSDTAALGDPTLGMVGVTSVEGGINYWYSKRFRLTFNYVFNRFDGDAKTVQSAITKNGGNAEEHEFLFRAAIAL